MCIGFIDAAGGLDGEARLPINLERSNVLPSRVLIAAAGGLDGEAAVLAAARLAHLRGCTAYQALIHVSHRRLALQLKARKEPRHSTCDISSCPAACAAP